MKRLNRIVVLMLAVFALFITCKSDGGGDPDDEGYTYTVTFDKNGGDTEATPATITVTPPATNVVALPTAPVKAGYAFAGWNTKADGTGTAFTATTTVTADITVYAKWEEAAVGDFHIVLENAGEETGDAVTRSPARADAGATVTITYTLANTKLNNRLTFSGTTETIEEVDEPGTGTRAYTVNEDDADGDGIIRILATFIHTDKTIDTIAFTESVVNVKFGETPTAITVSNSGAGSGTITYSSSNTGIATVDNNGQVTLVDVGSTIITATKEEDATYSVATASYTLHIGKGDGATLTGTLTAAANGVTEDSIEITAITPPANGQTIEYAISTTNSEPADGWHHSTTFTELNPSTTYYIFARAAGNDHYETGTTISGTFSTTASVAAVTSWNFLTTEPPIAAGYINEPRKVRFATSLPGAASTITWASGQGLTAYVAQSYQSKLLIIPFNLPSGKSLNDYTSISFNFIKETNDDTGGGKSCVVNVLKSGQTAFSDSGGGNNLGIYTGGNVTFAASPNPTELTLAITKTTSLTYLTGEIEIGFYFNVNPIRMRITSITLNE
jgi:uncharacterized repeat protein (TIGR02543 family)